MAITAAQKAGIANLYMGLFGRPGDPVGLGFWDAQLDSGNVTMLDIANTFAAQAEAASEYAYLSVPDPGPSDTSGFLNQVYQNLFHRNADDGGLAFWSSRLDTESVGGVVLDVISNAGGGDLTALASGVPVTDAQQAMLVDMYIGFLGRAPDPAGLDFWLGMLQSGQMTLPQVADSFASGPEAQGAHTYLSAPNLTAGIPGFVTEVYHNLFHRAADDGGLAFWSGALQAGLTPGQFMIEVINNASVEDTLALANRQGVASAYAGAVQSGGLNWTFETDGADAVQVLDGVTSDNTTLTAGVTTAHDLVAARLAVGLTYALSTGIDAIVGTSRNDMISGTISGSLSGFDNIDGGAGTDTLNVTDTSAIMPPDNVTVQNVEVVNLVSADTVTVDTTSWTGLMTLNVTSGDGGNEVAASGTTVVNDTSSGVGGVATTINGGSDVTVAVTGSTIAGIQIGGSVAPTGAVTVTNTSTDSGGVMGAIGVIGGTTVSITQAATNPANTSETMGTVTVAGGAYTTSVTVMNEARAVASPSVAGVIDNSVAIYDVNGGTETAGTITSVSVSNFTVFGIQDNALSTLSLTGGSGNMIIDDSGPTTPTNTTLNLMINGQTGGTLDDADIYTTLNVTTTGANSTLANITDSALQSLNVSGTKRLTLTSTAGMSSLATVAVAGGAGLAADLSNASVTAVDTSATTGASAIIMDGTRATFTGGAGADAVTLVNGATKAISLGAGDDTLVLGSVVPTAVVAGGAGTDTLSMDATSAATASGSPSFANRVTGFERLILTGSTNQTIDLAVLGIPGYVGTRGGNGLTLTNLNNGGTVALLGAGTAYTIANSAFASGPDDTVNLALSDGSGLGVAFASGGITMPNVEHIAITTADTQLTPSGTFNDLLTLAGNSSKTITVSGNAGLTMTANSTGLTSVDASGITLGGFTWTSGALAHAVTVEGSAAGTNTVNITAATQVVTYTGGSGSDFVTASNGQSNVVSLGDGTNSYIGTAGNQTITGGSGSDTVTVTSGNNTVSLGDGTNAFTASSGNNTYTGGSGADTVTVGGGANMLTLGSGANVVSITAATINANSYTTIMDPMAGDTISFADMGTEIFNNAKVTLGNTATLQDYANAVVTQGGNASVNGAFGWFQFAGDTYLAESRHDGSIVNANFTGGTDMIVKLHGLVDLTGAGFSHTNSVTLT